MVEAVMALSMLVVMFGLLTLVHRLSLSSLDASQEARSKAWQEALKGCSDSELSVGEFIRGLKSGDLPAPPSFSAGADATGSASRSVEGATRGSHHELTRSVQAPCNTRAIDAPSGSAGDWLFDLFQNEP